MWPGSPRERGIFGESLVVWGMSDMSQSYAVDDGSDVASHFLYLSTR